MTAAGPSQAAPDAPSKAVVTPAPPVPAPLRAAGPSPAAPAAAQASGAAPLAGGRGPAGAAGDVTGLLRGLLGCSHAQTMDLTPAERARCAERLGLASRTAPRIDPIPAEKRASYDAVAAAYARTNAPPGNAPSWFAGAPRAGLLADRGGLTIPLPVCGMRFGVPRGWKSYHDLPPHALKLARFGPLKCFVPPPAGRGFEESGVEAPASLRERADDAAHMKALDAPH